MYKRQEKGLLVIKLGKILYVLAQSPGNWLPTIDPVLISIGFVPLKSDTCIYIYNYDGVIIILTLYVDDLLVIEGFIQVMEKITSKLMEKFKMRWAVYRLRWGCRPHEIGRRKR